MKKNNRTPLIYAATGIALALSLILATEKECQASTCYSYKLSGSGTMNGDLDPTTNKLTGTLDLGGVVANCGTTQCFAHDGVVQIEEAGKVFPILMSNLKVGDSVVVKTNLEDGTVITDKVIDFFHREPHSEGTFVEIAVEGGLYPFHISAYHRIKKATHSQQSYDPNDNGDFAYAGEIKPGDFLFVYGAPTAVASVTHGVSREGMYAPITENTCMLEVDGIASSCLSEVKSQTFGKMYLKYARPLLVKKVPRDECTEEHSHGIKFADALLHRFVEAFRSKPEFSAVATPQETVKKDL